MLKPFFQGKLDTFCAIYAVINGLRLTHGIRTAKGREILNDTLLDLARDRKKFQDALELNTDYIELVDHMLTKISKKMPLEIVYPFKNKTRIMKEVFWQCCHDWLGEYEEKKPSRAIIFRFFRYLNPLIDPLNRHWTTADYIKGDTLHLFDCSHEAEAILNISKESFVTDISLVDREHLLFIQPDTVRFIRLPF